MVISDTEVTGLKVRINKSGTKMYYLFWKQHGKQRKYRIGKHGDIGVPVARKVARELRAKIALGQDPQAEKTQLIKESKREKIGTLRAFLEAEYFPFAEQKQKRHVATRKTLEREFKWLMDMQMDSINSKDVDKWQTKMLEKGNQPQTINRKMTALKAVLKKAVDWGVIESNPLRGKCRLKEGDNDVIRWLTDAERSRLEKILSEWDGYESVVVNILLKTGSRPGEILGLKWSAIDFQNNLITIIAGKTDTKRTVHMNDSLIEIIKEWRDKCPQSREGWLFPSPNNGHIQVMYKQWNRMKRMAKLENFRLYDCRHDCASRLVMNGVPIYTVSNVLGHKSVNMTQKYAHLAPAHLADAMKIL